MDVLMPQLGETVAEGKITKWYRSAGDAVKPGDNLFEIETDKVSMEVPATTTGVLAEIRVAAGEVAPVGAVVAVIAGQAGATTSPQAAATGAPPNAPMAPAASPPLIPAKAGIQNPEALGPRLRGDERQSRAAPASVNLDPFFEVRTPERNYGPAKLQGGNHVTPLARRLASEAGIDLARVTGSGPHGRIVARDIETAGTGAARVPPPPAAVGASAEQVEALYRDVPFEEVPLDRMRKTIAARLTQAKQTIPHFYLTADVDIGRLLALREEVNNVAPEDKGGGATLKLSVNDLVIKAWTAALQRVPAANAVWAEDRILRFQHVDIGIAVAIEGGLLTPVIRQAESKSLSAISAEIKELAERARAKKLKPNEYQGGASAISNLGMYGVREFAAIINPPHATILAVGAARRQAVERKDGGVAFASVMTVTLSCDHRVVDGALGAELLAAFSGFVENPVTAL
ncbi:MAG TPA: pyruvate dehydrogenase complex dihydrolipoamide acetyltransferase, partial [Xanthobacteraceae bacterium]|nr:pyruvate dehydrogenase complex dihydrolipoamide acetyltransferase [Xanthobacteraceae bacterium]